MAIEVRRDALCSCPKSVPGIIKYPHQGRSDETACLICLRKIDQAKALADMDNPQQFAARVCRAYVKALDELQVIARIPRVYKQIQEQVQRIAYLEATLYHMGYKPVYQDDGNFWKLEAVDDSPEATESK